jgi:ribonuclease HII
VVATAAWMPTAIEGVSDSKALTEAQREALFEQIVASNIDEINILQATLEAMRTALLALVNEKDNENQAVTTTVPTTKPPPSHRLLLLTFPFAPTLVLITWDRTW